MKKHTRILALFLALTLCIQMLPASSFAEESEGAANTELNTIETDNVKEAVEGRPGTEILGELTEKRTANGKHFRMDDGSFIAVDYGAAVHFSTDDGATWEDIDNTLLLPDSNRSEASADSADAFEANETLYWAENGDVVRGFSPDLSSGLLFSAANGNYGLRMGLVGNGAGRESSAGTSTDSDEVNVGSDYNTSSVAEISYPDVKTRGGEDLSLAEQVIPSKLRADVLYRNVYHGVDLSYELYSYDIKETILINQPQDNYNFSFSLDLEALMPELLEDGSIELRDADGKTIYLIPAPYMTDATGDFSNAVSYSLEKSDSGYWKLTVKADETWINSEDRAFPVSIDPTVIDKVTWSAQGIGVTYVNQGQPNETHTHYQNVYFGYSAYNSTKEQQVFIGWDTLPTVPAGSEVVNAQLYLCEYNYSSNGVPNIIGEIHAVTGTRPSSYTTNYDWICGLCWNTRPAVSGTTTDYVKMDSTLGFKNWDITELVKGWYTDSSTTRAACIKLANISSYSMSYYAAVTFRGYGHSYGPLFVVSYRDMTGIEPYYSYQALGADRAGAAYISDYTGALTTVTPLVSYASTVNPFSLNLIYNSSYFKGEGPDNVTVPLNLGYGMRMGSGMKLDLLQKVEYVDLQYEIESSGTKRYIKYTDGDGTAHYFATDSEKQANEPSGSTTYYYDEDGLGLKITEYATNYFRMEDDNGNQKIFVHGYLTIIRDANGNTINLYFRHSDGTMPTNGYPYGTGNRLEYITQKNNGQDAITVATFGYNTDDGTNTLHSVTDAAGNVYTFQYSCHKLRSVQRNSSAYVEFLHPYNSTTNRYVNPVVGLKDSISEYSLLFTYIDSKISSYYEMGGNTKGAGSNISRVSGEKTTYTDWGNDRTYNTSDDISTTYLFDYAGRAVNAFSTDINGVILGASNAVHTGTGDTDKQNNRTLRSAGIGMAGVSMVRNGGFEMSGSGLDWTIVKPEGSTCAATVKEGELTRTGTKAFKTWVNASATGPTGAKKLIGILTAGETYTASVYVNTSAATSFGNKGVYLRILDSYGSYKTGEYLNYKTDPAIDDGWVKLSFTFTAERNVNHYICVYDEGVKGAVYYDDLQVETGNAYTNVNLLDNGGITSNAAGWLTESGATPTAASISAIQGSKALSITGNPKTDKYIHQTVTLNQPGTQTYVLSGWAKANAVPDNVCTLDQETDKEALAKDTNKQFGLRAVLTYSDSSKEYHYVPFNADVTDWQFASLAIVPKQPTKTVSTIQVFCAYEKNANTAFFDNLSLVKEVAQTMKYDEDGNLVSVQSSGTKEETSTYDNGNLTQVKTGGSGTFDYTYDSRHNLTEATNSTVKEKYTYDSVGNVLTTALTKAEGNPTTAETIKGGKTYANGGNLVLTDKGANGCYTTFAYETNTGKMFGYATKVTNPVGTETVTHYHDDGRIQNSWISSYIAVNRSYDSKNQLTSLNRGGYNKTGGDPTPYNQYYNFAYDNFGNTTSISVGSASTYNLGSYTYAPKDGLLTGITYGNGATASYTYDDYGRKTQTTTSSGDSYTYAYTGDGQLYEMKDVSGSLLYRYTYDTLGRLIVSSMKSGSTVTLQTQHKYDDANRLSKQVWALPGKTYQENYIYDEDNGRLTQKKITLPTSETANITLGYDDLSRVSSVTTPATTTTFAYAGAFYGGGTTGLVSELSTTSVHTGSSVFEPLQLRYTYDALGNIRTEKKLSPSGSTAETLTYTYDNQSQLTKAVSSVNGTWNYQYDTYGNIRHQDHGNDEINYTYGDANWLDLLTAVSGTKNGTSFSGSYVYDGAGNPTSFFNVGDLSTWTMTWKNGRELSSAQKSGVSVTYDYDVSKVRTWKKVGNIQHNYSYASGQLLRENYTEGGTTYTLDFLYDQSNRPYMLYLTTSNSNGTTSAPYYYILNLQGDVVKLVNTSGVAVAAYEYDAFGCIISSTGSLASINPLRYRGYYYDSETGFYYLQSRYYDPALGRFINADSYSDTDRGFLGYNMFAYCGNNPITNVDPNGDSWWGWLAAAVIVTTLVVASVVTCGGAAVAAGTACAIMTGSCTAVGTTATVLTGAAVGASVAFAATAITAASESHSAEEFADYGTAALVNTTIGAGLGGASGYHNATHYCFVAGTLVYTETGDKPIDAIQPGEQVWAWDEETGSVALKAVVETYINQTDELMHVFVNGEEIVCTSGHPFYSPVKGWTAAVRLRAGDILVLVNGEYVVVEKVQHELLETPINVYNFQVEDYHTYYVSNAKVLVHNSCPQTGSYEIEFESGKNYTGKGSEARMYVSAAEHSIPNNDPVVSMHWDPAPSDRAAFVDEYFKMAVRGVNNDNTYNLIWSPGRRYFIQDIFSR